MSDVAIQRLRNEVRLSEENENSGFGQDILLVCNLCERLTDEVEQLKREVHFYRFGEEPDAAADKQAEQLPFPVCKHGVSLVHLVRCLKCDPADKGQCEHDYECVYEGAESETYQCKHCGDRYKLYDDEMR